MNKKSRIFSKKILAKKNNFEEIEPDIPWELYCEEVGKNKELEEKNSNLKNENIKMKNENNNLRNIVDNQKKIIDNKDKKINKCEKIIEKNNNIIRNQKITINNQKNTIDLKFLNCRFEGGKAIRFNPVTMERETFDVPVYFDKDNIRNAIPDENGDMIRYNFIVDEELMRMKEYYHPISIYIQMGGRLFPQEWEKTDDQTLSIANILKSKIKALKS